MRADEWAELLRHHAISAEESKILSALWNATESFVDSMQLVSSQSTILCTDFRLRVEETPWHQNCKQIVKLSFILLGGLEIVHADRILKAMRYVGIVNTGSCGPGYDYDDVNLRYCYSSSEHPYLIALSRAIYRARTTEEIKAWREAHKEEDE